MGNVLTIYNHGTCSSSQDTDYAKVRPAACLEIVDRFSKLDSSVDKIINEGPGSRGAPHLVTQTIEEGVISRSVPKNSFKTGITSASAVVTGKGVQNNVEMTFNEIKRIKPSKINMLGWSRGAVTSVRIAHKLYTDGDIEIKSIPINIFSVDPVAGPGHNAELDATEITVNVKNYFATLAMGEQRRFFKPVADFRLTHDPLLTNFCILPLPGTHADHAHHTTPSGEIVFDLAFRFLNHFESKVEELSIFKLKLEDICVRYEKLLSTPGSFHTTGNLAVLTQGLLAYNRTDEMKGVAPPPNPGNKEWHPQSGESPYFYNHHYQKVFNKLFPDLYTLLSSHKMGIIDPGLESARNQYLEFSSLVWGYPINRIFQRGYKAYPPTVFFNTLCQNTIVTYPPDANFRIIDSLLSVA